MPRAGLEPATPGTKRSQTYALDRAVTGIGDPKLDAKQNGTLHLYHLLYVCEYAILETLKKLL
jgi:hypothetical protein